MGRLNKKLSIPHKDNEKETWWTPQQSTRTQLPQDQGWENVNSFGKIMPRNTEPLGYCSSLNMLGLGSGTVRMCNFVGVGVALLEEGCHNTGGL